VVGKVVTFRETSPADVDGRVTPVDAGTLSDPGSNPQSTSEDGVAQVNEITPWKPLIEVTETDAAADCPWATDNGEAERLKSSGPSTVWLITPEPLPKRLESPL
jgi:hypothetical protein